MSASAWRKAPISMVELLECGTTIRSSLESMRKIRQVPTLFRQLIRWLGLVGVVLAGILAILEFSKGRLGGGAYALAFGALLLVLYFRARKREIIFSKIPSEFQFYEVYGFFGGWVIVGVTAFALAVLGVTPAGIAIGAAGLLVALGSVYAIARETQDVRRQREEAPKTNPTSETTGD